MALNSRGGVQQLKRPFLRQEAQTGGAQGSGLESLKPQPTPPQGPLRLLVPRANQDLGPASLQKANKAPDPHHFRPGPEMSRKLVGVHSA